MKTIIISLLAINFLTAQVPKVVYDPTAAVNMGKQIQSANSQLKQLERTVQYYEKAEKALSNVSGYVRNMEDIKEILELQQKSLSNAQKIRDNINKYSDRRKATILKNTANNLKEITSSISFINKILTNGFFKMNDIDRMSLIKEERNKVFFQYTMIRSRLN